MNSRHKPIGSHLKFGIMQIKQQNIFILMGGITIYFV